MAEHGEVYAINLSKLAATMFIHDEMCAINLS